MNLLPLSEAIARHVHDGDSVALEGFTHLIPFAAGHEIIRQQRRNLHLIRMTPDLIYDQLIGMGCAARLTFSWGGNPGVGSLHRLRDAVENSWPQPLTLIEHTHAEMAVAYQAGASGMPCGIMRRYADTDLMRVLLVEDSLKLSSWLCKALQQHGFTMDRVHDGSDADALLRTESYDAVILDIGLPSLDGLTVLQRMPARGSATRTMSA